MSQLKQTPSQTVGPYFAYGLTPAQYGYDLKNLFSAVLAQPQAMGEHIRISGQPVSSVADAEAKGFSGFGRCGTGTLPQHHYAFDTVKPAAAAPGQAPFINVCLTMRGLLVHSFTRIYFDDEAVANSQDAVLASVPAERRATLIARREASGTGPLYRFDIHMQGEQETVFFDL